MRHRDRTVDGLAERLWNGRTVAARTGRALLTPLSWAFSGVVRLRGRLYDLGLRRARSVEVPVVSVGNLRVGGTGKTPLVIWLALGLRRKKLEPCVVSRGYKAESKVPIVVVTAAHPASATVRNAGAGRGDFLGVVVAPDGTIDRAGARVADEAVLVALRTGCPVVSSPDRVAACRLAVRLFSPSLIVLDDGFQHRRLARDLDVVLVDEDDRRARVLPAGPLREPPSALARAGIVIANDRSSTGPYLVTRPEGLVAQIGEQRPGIALASLARCSVIAAAGIARPERFFGMIRETGADLKATLRFPDHHHYTPADWERVLALAHGADRIVTTEKDLVKLARLSPRDPRLLALRLAVEVDGGDALIEAVAGLDAKPRGQHDRASHVQE
jgi:tetraacyldisaccharide 4'-kinase